MPAAEDDTPIKAVSAVPASAADEGGPCVIRWTGVGSQDIYYQGGGAWVVDPSKAFAFRSEVDAERHILSEAWGPGVMAVALSNVLPKADTPPGPRFLLRKAEAVTGTSLWRTPGGKLSANASKAESYPREEADRLAKAFAYQVIPEFDPDIPPKADPPPTRWLIERAPPLGAKNYWWDGRLNSWREEVRDGSTYSSLEAAKQALVDVPYQQYGVIIRPAQPAELIEVATP